jgi:hypothetical protein
MANTWDQTSDKSYRKLNKFARLYELPQYVKSAAVDTALQAPKELPSAAFADARHRQFPCHTKAATCLSWLYFLDSKSEMHEKTAAFIEHSLKQFAGYWKIGADIEKLASQHKQIHKRLLPTDNDFLLVQQVKSASGEIKTIREYPVDTPENVKKAVAWFPANRYHWSFEERAKMADKILEKAALHGVAIDENTMRLLEQQAGRGCYEPKQAAQHIRNRIKAATKVPEHLSAGLEKMAQTVSSTPKMALDPDMTRELAKTIDMFDRHSSLAKMAESGRYTERIPSPEQICFPVTWKDAQAFVDTGCTLTTGSVYDMSDFSKIAVSDVRGILGDEIANAVTVGLQVDPEKMAEVAATLPRAKQPCLISCSPTRGWSLP